MIFDVVISKIGALGRIRTPDPLVRSQILYPTELPARDLDGVTEDAYSPCFSYEVKRIIGHFIPTPLFFLIILLLALYSATVKAENSFIRIGVLNNQNKPPLEVIQQWYPTADYLAMTLPGYDFEIVPLGFYEIEAAVGKGKIDFILTNPGIFINLAARNWVTPMVTINNVIGDASYSSYASVIITRSDNEKINQLNSLKGVRFMAVNENSFGGFQMAWREMNKAGLNPHFDLLQLIFVDNHQQVVKAIIDKKVDAGTVRTDTLEKMLEQGLIDKSMIKIINAKQSTDFPLVHSTAIYPEWPFSKVQHVSHNLSEKVTLALLRMPSDFPSRFSGGYAKWTLPRDYSSVHTLFKELKLPPYALSNEFTLIDVIIQYWYWALLGLITLVSLLIIISESRRRNKHLKIAKDKLEHQYELIVNSVTDGIYGVDIKGQCTFVNQAMQDMTGWKSNELLGKKLLPILHHTRKDGSLTSVAECPMYDSFLDSTPHFNSDDIFWKKNGESISVEYSSTPINDQSGKLMGGVVVFRNISERKEASEKLQQHQLQLSHVARLSMLGEMASGIAHEINQPLTAIATNSTACIRMLETSNPNIDKCADTLEKIVNQAERAGEVIRHIRHFVVKEAPEMKPVPIKNMMDTVLQLLHSEIQRQDIQLIVDLSELNDLVLAQDIQIEQVMMNLVRNAIESLENIEPHKRKIIFSTFPVNKNGENNRLEIRVSDSGHGLCEKVKEQLFSPFITTKNQGMGLGLSISQSIVEAHGDRIHVDSDHQGASFYFSLPIC